MSMMYSLLGSRRRLKVEGGEELLSQAEVQRYGREVGNNFASCTQLVDHVSKFLACTSS